MEKEEIKQGRKKRSKKERQRCKKTNVKVEGERQYAVTLSGETLLPLSDEKSICYQAIINYIPQRIAEGAWGLVCMCVSSRNRTPTQLVRQLAKEKKCSSHYQDRPTYTSHA